MTLQPTVRLLWYDAQSTDGSDLSRVRAVYECEGKRIVIRADEPAPDDLVRKIAASLAGPKLAPDLGQGLEPGIGQIKPGQPLTIVKGQGFLLAI